MPRIFKLMVAGLMAFATAFASAQSLDPNSAVNAGAQLTKMIDEGRYAEVWEGASVVMKKAAEKGRFVESVAKARAEVGAVTATNRFWVDVSRRDENGTAQLPSGVYVNVQYRTTFANGKTARELVSFRLDDDKIWRFTGYVIN